ncbi:Mrp/NBP35 family ATP-binding protein [Arcobacter sp. FWKO B]|uniref:Mrp/NBP35 family ATP-binding protein n=1 Tax=Arcobacter sp. FWKO B TaxID=2593672 RepID=UPI0018A688F1|nr:Mrp/NBP35 family ATP-binding protein [Arcobacter sp. FWKO B]QOG12334.1 Mrp/NBP35 family ATP-binding protein [Arcobacter sp. FWKO B]
MVTKEQVLNELKSVMYPGFTKSIVDFGFVRDIIITDNNVSINLEITSSAQEVEQALKDEIKKELSILGIQNYEINIKKPSTPKQQSNSVSGKNVAPQIKNFVMVSSGKGGVGKSTTTVNLAIAMAMQGKRVGVLDADIYGPNIPRMLGLIGAEPEVVGNKAKPLKAYGIDMMSMGSLMGEGQALIWRGAMIMKAIEQLLRDILWEELDVLFIDMPPGTGDAQLTLAQSVPVTAGVNVTTPQHVALDDSKRSLDMFKKLHIPVAGIVENMSGFICPNCETESDIFGIGTCEALAKDYGTTVLANIPIEPAIREGGDDGKPIVYFHPESVTAKRYMQASAKLWDFIENVNSSNLADNSAIQPTTNGVSACSTTSQSSSKGGCGCH